jgi:hypothetical protein
MAPKLPHEIEDGSWPCRAQSCSKLFFVSVAVAVAIAIASGHGSLVLITGTVVVATGAAVVNDELRIVSPDTVALGFYPTA